MYAIVHTTVSNSKDYEIVGSNPKRFRLLDFEK